ncbi:MAG: alpha/beta fold hydrolase [Candidatus Rokubacteria bacterium]|nr:alpha/beta fold hydrolase [Candidatus Rokubacteria bacterium]
MPAVSIGDADISYEEAGQGAPLVLVTGLNGVGSFWVRQVPAFLRDFRVVTHDHRGTGKSTHSRITYSVDQMADDTLRLMDRLGIERAHFVGHSTGGAIGQTIAQDHPERLASLVLSATWAGHDPYFRRLFEMRKAILLTSGVEAYLQSSILVLAPPAWISANDAAIATLQRQQAAEAAPVDVMASRIDAIVAFDRRAKLSAIRTPTLVIVAADDMVTPRFYSDELAGRIPGAKLVVLAGGGHFAPQLNVEAYNDAVGAFLKAHAPR